MAPERPQPKNKLQEWFPNTKLPIIMSAPMLGVADGILAAHVSKAGGFGQSLTDFYSSSFLLIPHHPPFVCEQHRANIRDQDSSPGATTSAQTVPCSRTLRRSSRPPGTPSAWPN